MNGRCLRALLIAFAAAGLVLLGAQAARADTPTPAPGDWACVTLPGREVRDLALDPGNPQRMLLATAGDNLGLYASNDGGRTWSSANNGLGDLNVLQLTCGASAPWTVYAASEGRLWRTTDAGENWVYLAVSGATFSRISGLAAAPASGERLYLTTWEHCPVLFSSSNGGLNWGERQGPDLCAYGALDSALQVSWHSADLIYLARAHDRPELYRTGDAGVHWTRLADISIGYGVYDLALDPSDDDHLYAATYGGGVYVTRDGGATWNPASAGLPGSGVGASVTALAVHPSDGNNLYAAVQGTGVYVSDDGGDWWRPCGAHFPSGAIVYALRLSAQYPQRLWAATSDGLWVSTPWTLHLPLIVKYRWLEPTPTPSATPTATDTATPGPSPTSTTTPTVTPSPTPTLTPTGQMELIANGGFELAGAWSMPATESTARRSMAAAHSGAWSLQSGVVPPAANTVAHSSCYQTFTVPSTASTVTLRLWFQRFSEEPPTSDMDDASLVWSPALGFEIPDLSEPAALGDYQEVLLLNTAYQLVAKLHRGRSNDGTWTEFTSDLTAWRGRTLVLYLNTYNDGLGGRTWMYVDDVSILAGMP